MKVSIKWLQEFISGVDNNAIIDLLPTLGHGVEEIIDLSQDGIITAKVIEIKEHRKRRNLSILKLFGNRSYQVICGAKNMKVGDILLLALPGAIINGQSIEKTYFDGVKSEGMVVSETELGITESSEGIVTLDRKIKSGLKFNDLFDTQILDLEVTPNRGDCESILGVARDLAVVLKKQINNAELKPPRLKPGQKIIIENFEDCPRYTAMFVENVKVSESPFLIKWRLFHHGIRPINSLVDITNYIMLMYGQPLHAFDMSLIKGNIKVRRAKKSERMITLDGTKIVLDSNHLIIADQEGPIALAGVVGGKKAEINKKTNKILLESATFNPEVVRKTTRGLMIDTQSGRRFERGTDPAIPPLAAQAAAEMIGGRKLAFTDIKTTIRKKKIACDCKRISKYLGVKFKKKEIISILDALDFKPRSKGFKVNVSVPTYRRDIDEECDVTEEVARIYGYDRIPSNASLSNLEGFLPKKLKVMRKLRAFLIGLGFFECHCFTPTSKGFIDILQLGDAIKIKNPLNERFTHLKPSLAPALIEVLATNYRNGLFDIRMFEIGKVFIPDKPRPKERNYLGFIIGGRTTPIHWSGENRMYDFFDVKGVLELVVKHLEAGSFDLRDENIGLFEDFSSKIVIGGNEVGCLGQLSGRILDYFDVKDRYFFMEVDLDRLFERTGQPIYIPYPKYPKVKRDLAFIVDSSIPAVNLIKQIKTAGGPLLSEVIIFDRYQGEEFTKGKVSLGFRLTFQPEERTLTEAEIRDMVDNIASGLETNFGAQLRDKGVNFG